MIGFGSGLIGEFSSIFPYEQRESFEYYLKGNPKKRLIRLATFFLGFKNVDSKYKSWKDVLNMWFRIDNYTYKMIIWEECIKIENGLPENENLTLIYVPAILRFLEWVSSKEDNFFCNIDTDAQSEIKVFKAIMCFNEDELLKMANGRSGISKFTGQEKLVRLLFHYDFPVADIQHYDLPDIATVQLIKATLLFDYLLSNKECEHLLQEFFHSNKYKNWTDYLAEMTPITNSIIESKIEGWVELSIDKNSRFQKNFKSLQKLNYTGIEEDAKPDFLYIRSNPLYQISDSSFLITYPLFAAENTFKSLYFKLKEINNKLPESFKLKDWKRKYTKEFSESHILYYLLNHIFKGLADAIFSGDDLASKHIKGSPDYYIRIANKIFIFENKDILINASIKASCDFEAIETELKKKLHFEVKDGKTKPAAVKQIVENIRRIRNQEYKFDNYSPYDNIELYPILILHDTQFNSLGLNSIVNTWYKEELSSASVDTLHLEKERDLTIIGIDFFILYADYLKYNLGKFSELIDSYILNANSVNDRIFETEAKYKQALGNSLLPFSFYANIKTDFGHKFNKEDLIEQVISTMKKHE